MVNSSPAVERIGERVSGADSGERGGSLRHLGEAEIQNFCLAALADENIGGLDVAMDDAFGVRGFERVGDLDARASSSLISKG